MIVLENRTLQIDDLLDKMAEELQLDDTRYDRMKSSYESVKDWIENDEVFFKPYKYDVYPHGSVRILTTVKPLETDEFDLDVAVHILNTATHTPQRIYNELKRVIEKYALKHNLIFEAKNRCVRLNYAGDYHMDILPGVQENTVDPDKIKIPDRSLGAWVSSSPRGYSKWFLATCNLATESLLERAIKTENLPADNFKYKKPLQRAVQLIKRYRDLYFQGNASYKTSSIILTTIAGQFYQGEDSIFNTIDNIITSIHSKINAPFSRLKVLNPVNQDEDFTDKWDSEPEYYSAFKSFAMKLYNDWQTLKTDVGVIEEGVILKRLFGEDIFKRAQSKQAKVIEDRRNNNLLGVTRSSGVLSSINTKGSSEVKQNTFYGG
jgi:hypothetical protein